MMRCMGNAGYAIIKARHVRLGSIFLLFNRPSSGGFSFFTAWLMTGQRRSKLDGRPLRRAYWRVCLGMDEST
jgi:hypothetical protein